MSQMIRIPDPYTVSALNYATDSENRIHSDEMAARYGFRGGLVPGVGVYAYMTRAMTGAYGMTWVEHGWAEVKFLKPVYDGEEVTVSCFIPDGGGALHVELKNEEDALCAVAGAQPCATAVPPDAGAYALQPLPDFATRPDANLESLAQGVTLGTLDVPADEGERATEFLDAICDEDPMYRGADAPCNPAYFLALANDILVQNVRLGPWIHAGSEVQHYALAKQAERLQVRGRVLEAVEKKGHEMVVLDLLVLRRGHEPVASIRHTAIIRPRAGM